MQDDFPGSMKDWPWNPNYPFKREAAVGEYIVYKLKTIEPVGSSMAEHTTDNREAEGSTPSLRTTPLREMDLAEAHGLVLSVCDFLRRYDSPRLAADLMEAMRVIAKGKAAPATNMDW